MYLSYAQAILIVVGLCTAGISLAETSVPSMLTVQEVEAGEIFPLVPGESTFEVVDGDGEGRQVVLELSSTGGEGRWEARFGDYNILHLFKRRDGSVLLTGLDVLTQGQTVLYEPPVVLLPNRIVPDRTWSASGRATVVNRETQEVIHKGEYQHRVMPITRERYATPAGDYEGFLVPLEQTIDLEAQAVIRLWLDLGFFPGKGLVKRSMKFVVDKPLWFGSTTRRTAELVR
ncbi:hypothetical protein VRRI112168_13735 [Vreelandella rituensis]|uniref:Uncharacterized protein n=1 Tax=Vreelandella rituensis TaxID=2282306 RepID=A0A368TRS2_9GAMM|nr:hypothetical protein [Halomonas rituensis]RCV87415.1 hypothetical protein DU506_16640 [Halomonas rituensis]